MLSRKYVVYGCRRVAIDQRKSVVVIKVTKTTFIGISQTILVAVG